MVRRGTLTASLTSRLILFSISALSCFASVQAAADTQDAAGLAILARYAASAENGDTVAAVGYLLDYSELTEGEYAPQTARLTHRYGVLLMRSGDYRRAITILKTALKRSNVAFGEFAEEAFETNMDIGYAYSQLGRRRVYSTDYFDRALEVLRQRGEHETVLYVSTLLNIVASLADKEGLSGNTSTTVVDNDSELPGNEWLLNLQDEYRNSFYKVEAYLEEAALLADELVHEDKYLPSKVAIARVKLGVLETTDLAKVAMGVSGRISQRTVSERNDRDEEQLTAAMTVLSEDPEANAVFLAIANATLLEIAWLDNDKSRMMALCASGAVDSSADYPPDRLFKITADGDVIAPNFGFYVPLNLFEKSVRRGKSPSDENGNRILQPYFVPVCINGELMAALVNAPRVTIEEYR